MRGARIEELEAIAADANRVLGEGWRDYLRELEATGEYPQHNDPNDPQEQWFMFRMCLRCMRQLGNHVVVIHRWRNVALGALSGLVPTPARGYHTPEHFEGDMQVLRRMIEHSVLKQDLERVGTIEAMRALVNGLDEAREAKPHAP